jgi:hypothetical protein
MIKNGMRVFESRVFGTMYACQKGVTDLERKPRKLFK